MSTTTEAAECGWCGEKLTPEDIEYPERASTGDLICESCWDEECRDYCERCGERCGERVNTTDLAAEPGSLIGVWRSTPGLSERVRRGYYRVKMWPFFAYSAIDAHFYSDALERVGPLDNAGREAGREAQAMAGPICPNCQSEVLAATAAGFARATTPEGGNDDA
jgi:hypothetical protein